jgi:AcrR family transcriptional regulator
MDGDGRSLSRAERKREEVLTAARRRFIEDGYAGAGMEAVARNAGVSTATLYSYFPSKADLFREVLTESTEALSRGLHEIEEQDGPAREQLTRYALAYSRFWSDPYPRAMFRLLSAERRRFEAAAQHFHERARAGAGAVLIRMLDRLCLKGELVVGEPAGAAGQLLGMLEHPTLMYGLVVGDDARTERPVEEISTEAVTTFLARYGASAQG